MFCDNFVTYGRAIINWKLQNFNKDLLDSRNVVSLPPLYSPDFRVVLSNHFTTKWKFLASRNKSELTLYLKRVDDMSRRCYTSYGHYIVKFDVQIKDQINDKWLKRTHGKVEFHNFEEKLGKIVNEKDCSRPRSYRILLNSIIHIVVHLEIIRRDIDISAALNSTLSSHYEKMFNNQSFSDFQIITSDGKEIYVHRNILSIRSPVFEAMITSTMKEGTEKKVLIDDIDGRTLMELIRFVYSGKVNEIDSIATELIYAANKYDLQDLKPLCVESLAFNIDVNNALETLVLADLHQEKYLKKFAIDFIKFKYSEIKDQPGWENLSHHIMKDILDYVMAPSGHKTEDHTIITNIKRSHTVNTNPAQ
ncbi:speckle-type POZ protein-like [Chironomus tepperi]|uniref:speckle-type POZ protein-like n=1 Tax=Chironomus tepperi TaxID=113505 RepID=UPI00391F41EA